MNTLGSPALARSWLTRVYTAATGLLGLGGGVGVVVGLGVGFGVGFVGVGFGCGLELGVGFVGRGTAVVGAVDGFEVEGFAEGDAGFTDGFGPFVFVGVGFGLTLVGVGFGVTKVTAPGRGRTGSTLTTCGEDFGTFTALVF